MFPLRRCFDVAILSVPHEHSHSQATLRSLFSTRLITVSCPNTCPTKSTRWALLATSRSRQPQDFVFPLVRLPARTATIFPQQHRHCHIVTPRTLGSRFTAVSLPSVRPARSINFPPRQPQDFFRPCRRLAPGATVALPQSQRQIHIGLPYPCLRRMTVSFPNFATREVYQRWHGRALAIRVALLATTGLTHPNRPPCLAEERWADVVSILHQLGGLHRATRVSSMISGCPFRHMPKYH